MANQAIKFDVKYNKLPEKCFHGYTEIRLSTVVQLFRNKFNGFSLDPTFSRFCYQEANVNFGGTPGKQAAREEI